MVSISIKLRLHVAQVHVVLLEVASEHNSNDCANNDSDFSDDDDQTQTTKMNGALLMQSSRYVSASR